MLPQPPLKLGFIPANRGFFDGQLAARMRAETLQTARNVGVELVVPEPGQTHLGCVDTLAEAETCAELFRQARVDGILISAVNFGSEQGAAWTVKQAGLNVPILLFACQEEEVLHPQARRRDAFCGLLSIGEVLRQIGVPYSVAEPAIGFPREPAFQQSLEWFLGVCRVLKGIRSARYGQVGARPDSFWTCRFDEVALQRLGPTTVTLDLSEVLGAVSRMADDAPEVRAVLNDLPGYAQTQAMSPEALLKFAKLEAFLDQWGQENRIDAFAIQCWTSIQQNFGVCACTTMSRLTDRGRPAACEADILGTLSMHALQLAGGHPAALADWNNLHNEDPDLVNLWHCGVFPKSFAREDVRLEVHGILPDSGAATAEQSQGVVELVAKAGPATLARFAQDGEGLGRMLIAEGAFEDNAASTFGSYGWCRLPGLLPFYRNVLMRHFPHHVAVTQTHVGNVLWEAFGNYLGLPVHHSLPGSNGAYQPQLPFPV